MAQGNIPLILIVDDEEDFPEIISAKLSAAGMTTVHVKDPRKAVEEIAKQKPDLILMDINMPEESGADVMLDLRQNEITKNIKIAFLTNSKEPWPGFTGAQVDVAKELGADEFLQKTEDLNVLLSKVQKLLGMDLGKDSAAAPALAAPVSTTDSADSTGGASRKPGSSSNV